MIEAMARLERTLLADELFQGQLAYLARWTRFLKPVIPGDTYHKNRIKQY